MAETGLLRPALTTGIPNEIVGVGEIAADHQLRRLEKMIRDLQLTMEVPVMSPPLTAGFRLSLLMILAVTACGKSPPKQAANADSVAFVKALEHANSGQAASPAVPKDLVPVALAAAQDDSRHQGLECKDYKVQPPSNSSSLALAVTDADRANGIEDKWDVAVSYVAKGGAGPWKDEVFEGVFTKQNGAWKMHYKGNWLLGSVP